jgi:glycosyltransferase involved in cell wall biosynthesis
MRIAINADYLAEPHTGTGRYLTQLITSLGLVDGVNEYALLTSRPVAAKPPTPSTFTWEEVTVSGPSEAWRKVHWEQRVFPEVARKREARLLFVPHFAPPWRPTLPVVTTIHDVIPFALPDYRPLSAGVWAYQQLVAQGARRATQVITVSEHAKSEIIRYLGIPAEKIAVIAEAPAPHFRAVSDTQRLKVVRAKYGVGERFFMYLGGFDARKNVPLLIGAFAALTHRLNDPSLKLLISGDTTPLGSSPLFPDWQPLVRKFGLEARVVSAFVADDDLPAMYSAALAFVYPSLYEGFGLPPLEAMACGAPVITSDHPALSEVTEGAGLTFALGSGGAAATRALADQMMRVAITPELRDDERLRSLARARHFSWAQTAAETSSIFAEISGTRA